MRLLHTADWHLGRSLHGVDLLDYQAGFLDAIVELVAAERLDGVLVAGDVFDRAVPPVGAVELFGQTLSRLAEHCPVVVISGNHDSPARLGFTASVLRPSIQIRTRVGEVDKPIELGTGDDQVNVYAVPYLDPDATRGELTPDGAELVARSHEGVLGAAMQRIRAAVSARPAVSTVVVAHAFVTGGEASESERDIRVGGVDNVPAGVFDGIDYVALGHLHGPQQLRSGVPKNTTIRYAGSPLAYSFSEAGQRKSVTIVQIGPGGVAAETVPMPVPRKMVTVTGTLADLLGPGGEEYVDCWVRAFVTDQQRPTDLFNRLKARFPHLLNHAHTPPDRVFGSAAPRVDATSDPLDVGRDFLRYTGGTDPTPAEDDVLVAAFERARAQEGSH